MPRTDTDTFRCFCTNCINSGGYDADGTALGCPIPLKNRIPHLRRAQMESGGQNQTVTPPQPTLAPTIDDITAALLATTITDDGPVIDSQPSRLWTSRDSFQKLSS